MEGQGETKSAGSWFGAGLCEFLRNSAPNACSFLKTTLGAWNSLYTPVLGAGTAGFRTAHQPGSSPASAATVFGFRISPFLLSHFFLGASRTRKFWLNSENLSP